MSRTDIPTTYDPKRVEERMYQFWLDRGYFHAEPDPDPSREKFVIMMPPPNITGTLHVGHALGATIQDILTRWKRMQGANAVWIPGTDHASIATEAKIVKALADEGLTKADVGREGFLKRAWEWKEKYGNTIVDQQKKLGASCDWSRARFTMDPICSRAVREVFVRLFEKGLIYRGNRMVNWCASCGTSLSDVEVEHEDVASHLWTLEYPMADGSGSVRVATTRPETMLGDTAVAVNPGDERYAALVGKTVVLPIMNREIPIIADEHVDPSFGTGAVKVTPAHDPNDFEIAERHGLPMVTVIGSDGRMTKEAGKFAGLDRMEARRQVVEELKRLGRLQKIEDYTHAVGHCQRCGAMVEPLVSLQWFVKMEPLAKPALKAVYDGDVRFVPERFARTYLHWMENVKDWCISRQLWWGHRIPVWYCDQCGEVFASVDEPKACRKCGSENIRQDPDVLDTWFSSALWPFSTLGWPDETKDLKHFYPTSVLVTGFDIIFFWVARMIVMGYEFMGERPFKEVFIHGLVRDALGRKMSKSLGNGVDPLDAIDEYGADALRFNLVIGVAPGNDMRYIPEKVEAYRNFANKIWNAARFALMNLEDFDSRKQNLGSLDLTIPDYWILSRYEFTAKEVTRFLERYDVGEAARVLYDFIWSELCDWYIELIKPRLYGKDGAETRYAAQYVLWYVLKGTLELLHPFMPFITEEIWQNLPHDGQTIMLAPWPQPAGLSSPSHERIMTTAMAVITQIRTMRSEKNVQPGRRITAICQADTEGLERLAAMQGDIMNLAGLEKLILEEPGRTPEKCLSAVVEGINIFLPLAELVDLAEEAARIQKELEQARRELQRAEKNLQNEGFIGKAPQDVVEREKEKAELYRAQVARLEALLQELQD